MDTMNLVPEKAEPESPDGPGVSALTIRRPGRRGDRAIGIWVLNGVIVALAAIIGAVAVARGPRSLGFDVPWLALVVGFYLAELLIVHLQFRKDAHTFSMSEIPMLIGVAAAGPVALISAQSAGSLAALTIHRHQRPVKLVFNLGQLALQSAVAYLVFDLLAGEAVDLRMVVAAVASMLAALMVGHGSVYAAIHASGGRESVRESLQVLGVSSVGTVGATLLAVGALIIMSAQSHLWWLGLVPVALVFVAYRAYVGQAEDKSRVVALFDAATTLHRNPQIDRAVATVTDRVLDLVKAETAQVTLLSNAGDSSAYVTTAHHEGARSVFAPAGVDGQRAALETLTSLERPAILDAAMIDELRIATDFNGPITDAIVVPLSVAGAPVGLLAAVNRVGDVSAFTHDDMRVLATLGSQLAVSLENGRLTETLDELRQLQAQLEDLLESKVRLIGSVSHELRTPLTGVIGLASVVRDSLSPDVDSGTSEMLDLIVEQGTELSNIIEDLLTHARAESGTLTVKPSGFDVGNEVAMVLATNPEPVEVRVEVPGITAYADPLRFRQILRNLLTNARRYGGPHVSVTIVRSGVETIVTVADDGDGVPDVFGEEIFQPYFSAHDQSGQPGSVGLGLALARTIARLNHGDLTYARVDGHTRFNIALPASPEAAVSRPVPQTG